MLKGKKLWVVLGVGAVAYYLFMQNKKNKAAKVIAAPASNFTGDLGIPEYQNGVGVVPRDSDAAAARAYAELAKRKKR